MAFLASLIVNAGKVIGDFVVFSIIMSEYDKGELYSRRDKMSYTIRLTPSQLRGKAQDIDTNAKIVQQEVASIETLINQLKPTFLGQTASGFFKDFNQARGNMERWDDVVRSFATEIREAANRLERADRS